jgi:cell division protein FtsW (lipid II flippase)
LTDTYHDYPSIIDRRELQFLSLAFIFLFASSLAVALAPGVQIGEWKLAPEAFQHFLILPVWVLGVFLIARTAREKLPNRDPMILPIGALLAGWGLIAIWRLTPTFGARQTGWFFLAALMLVVLFRAPPDLRWLRHYRFLWLGGGLFLLALTLVFGTNPLGGDPKLWLGCCGVFFQPSEPLRLLLIAFLASYFADRLVFRNKDNPPTFLQTFVPLLIIWSTSILLLFVQRDLGTGSLFVILLAVLLYIASEKWQVLLSAAGLTIIGGVIAYTNMNLVQIRINAWLNPWLDPVGGSYQIVQSLIAFASGGILGTGVGLGEPGLVPAAHTDFIYAAIGEEWGILGALGMLALFAILVARGIKIASQSQNHFYKLLAAGISVAFGLQSILIIGGVTRLLPLTGITLPFVSYGGSSLVTSFIALGLLMQISNKAPRETELSKPLRITQLGLNAAWLSIGLVLIWWSVYRAPSLTGRTDNLRRTLTERFYKRGTIYDSKERILAESVGEASSLERTYPYAENATVVGYQSTLFGKSGIESSMDTVLHGDSGHDPFILAWSTLLKGHPPSGLDIRLTIDAEVQEYATVLFDGEIGALVLLDSENGEVLTLITSPGYDPNSLEEDWDELIIDENAPLLNRTTQARYQPGMAIVPFLLAWGEDKSQLGLDDVIDDAFSSVIVGDYEFECIRLPITGLSKTLRNAMEHGCPGAFASLAQEYGHSWLFEIYDAFGFTDSILLRINSANPIELDEVTSADQVGLAGIGQGQLVITPIQMARAFAAVASEGNMPPLKVISSTRDPDGMWVSHEPLGSFETVISSTVAKRVMNTAQPYQNGVRGYSINAITGPNGQTSAWFMGADVEGRILVIFLENGTTSQAEGMGQELFQHIRGEPSP